MNDQFLRVAVATPAIRTADCAYNLEQILEITRQIPEDTALLVFPELCITGYTCGDLFLHPTLLQAAEQAVKEFLAATADRDTLLAVGVPVPVGSMLYNCAAICQRGKLLGLVPKKNLPNHSEFYERRHFTPAQDTPLTISFAGQTTVLSRYQLFASRDLPAFRLGVELGEDLSAVSQPSEQLVAAGATVIANLSAASESVGKTGGRRQLVTTQSARLHCAYLLANAGEGESTTDLVFAGHNLISEDGKILTESQPYTTGCIYTEIDLERLVYERRRITTFPADPSFPTVSFDQPVRPLRLTRSVSALPFVPDDRAEQSLRFEEILRIQAHGLAARLRHTGSCALLGLSGGLDSALALLVAIRAYDQLGWPHEKMHVATMPCYGTTGRTLGNARSLAQSFGVTLHEIDISQAVTRHLSDIGHEGAHDVTYENAQARERTQVLMDLANRFGGLVVGTGDLSELALGWATYNGDHMSMYGVNASIPKTLVRYLVAYEANRWGGAIQAALTDILDTPVSPELLPPENGVISQKTEQIVGPYELHDFFLYYMLRYGFSPSKIFRLAQTAFRGRFEDKEIKKWLCTFLRRFFSQQFKRSCLPDGPRVGKVALSPRGDWRMPSDASAALWLKEAESLLEETVLK